MTLATILIFIMWAATVAALYAERKERIAMSNRALVAEAGINAAKKVVERKLRDIDPRLIDARVKPMVDEMRASDEGLTGDQKRMRVILRYMKAHPGASVDDVETAIERVYAG